MIQRHPGCFNLLVDWLRHLARKPSLLPDLVDEGKLFSYAGTEVEKQVAFLKKTFAWDTALPKAQLHHRPDDGKEPDEVAALLGDDQKPLCVAGESSGCTFEGAGPLPCQLTELVQHLNHRSTAFREPSPTLIWYHGVRTRNDCQI